MRTSQFTPRLGALIISSALLVAGTASGEEVRVMTAGGMAAAHLALVSQFERATGHTVVTDATSTGIGSDSIASRVRRGEPVDVIILTRAGIDELIDEGRVVAASRVDLARSSIGMAVRRGTPKPDISTVDALKRALLQAESIAYSAQVSGVYLSTELFPRLGIADQVMKKSKRVEVGRVGVVLARGEAEIGFQQISELLEVPGIDYVGPLPAEVQRVTVFSAGIAVGARNPNAARALTEPSSSLIPSTISDVAPATCSTGRESDVECAAGTHGKHRRAIICGSEVLPLTWRAIHSAANRLWRAAGVGDSDGSRGDGCVNHLIAELNRSRVH